MWECGYLTFAPYITAKNFIRAVLHPDPARRVTAEQALSYTWLKIFAAPMRHDLCDLRENFDPCIRWRNVIGAPRAMTRFAKSNGANKNKKAQMALSSDDEPDNGGRSGSPTWRATPEPDSDSSSTFHLHRHWMIARYGAGCQDSWQKGLQR